MKSIIILLSIIVIFSFSHFNNAVYGHEEELDCANVTCGNLTCNLDQGIYSTPDQCCNSCRNCTEIECPSVPTCPTNFGLLNIPGKECCPSCRQCQSGLDYGCELKSPFKCPGGFLAGKKVNSCCTFCLPCPKTTVCPIVTKCTLPYKLSYPSIGGCCKQYS
ncbi:hypothetical protein DFA_04279 [Cavenderia fasciculata]|uniref:Uncharacterized protein n=1 Tax=Cavenderia fasciculata TaxID=261658 RepID=F4PP48_CACFS|nr:uncharacterized protein DFA_04279 [Cavenderia fasciculata]EGG22161.1 hypothetical protein DFA_04279 [Cavenderia fasciculata]|eukprot:XP_004360012.1 hypothetical protein DFA_04279 [Cavenderia fasciculata]